jgi:hypothetical protein
MVIVLMNMVTAVAARVVAYQVEEEGRYAECRRHLNMIFPWRMMEGHGGSLDASGDFI